MVGLMKKRLVAIALWSCLVLLAVSFFTRPAESQYMGNVSQASTLTQFGWAAFPVGPSGNAVMVPCGTGVAPPCIRMIGQVSHAVSLYYTGGGTNACQVFFDGSADGSNWYSLGAWNFPSTAPTLSVQTGTITVNAFYPLVRVVMVPPAHDTCAGLTGTYLGFQTPVPISNVALPFKTNSVSTPVAPGYASALPYLVTGFNCTNSNGSTAWLNLFDALASPTDTTKSFYEIAILTGQTFSYSGPAMLGQYTFYASAVTAEGGAVAVSTPLSCTFELNYWGPFTPTPPLDRTTLP
jgi:hypothetical protein